MEKLDLLIKKLTKRLKRVPTEEEVWTFINGSATDRLFIWNKVKDELGDSSLE